MVHKHGDRGVGTSLGDKPYNLFRDEGIADQKTDDCWRVWPYFSSKNLSLIQLHKDYQPLLRPVSMNLMVWFSEGRRTSGRFDELAHIWLFEGTPQRRHDSIERLGAYDTERQMVSPTPVPPAFVVKKVLKRRSK